MNDISVLGELRSLEKEQEKKLEQIQTDSLNNVEKAKKGIDKELNVFRDEGQSKKESEIENTKEKAKEEAKDIVTEYERKIIELEKKASKNSGKAVDKIFSMILDKNV